MSLPFYSPTELYRRLHIGSQVDIEFYLRAAQDAENILELGCGWGRISLPLAQAGYQVTAVDIEPDFLDELAQSSVALSESLIVHQQDVRQLALPLVSGQVQTFDRILLPYNMLYALGGARGVLQCFQQAARHLSGDGELWFDVYDMDEFHDQYDPADDVEDDEAVASWSHGNEQLTVFEHTQVLHEKKRLHVTYTAQLDSDRCAVGQLSMCHDYLLSEEMEELLDQAGFELVGRYELPEQPDDFESSNAVFYCARLSTPDETSRSES